MSVRPDHPILTLTLEEAQQALASIYDGFYHCDHHEGYCPDCPVNGGDMVDVVGMAFPAHVRPEPPVLCVQCGLRMPTDAIGNFCEFCNKE